MLFAGKLILFFACIGLLILDFCVLLSPPQSAAQTTRALYGVVGCTLVILLSGGAIYWRLADGDRSKGAR